MNKLIALMLLLAGTTAFAGPGAHGPNGEHLDGPTNQAQAVDSKPRFEAFTENFEMVGTLNESELSLFIDDYKTNAPVLGAELTLAMGEQELAAEFHVDGGDYALSQPELLQLLNQPGEHELIFTLITDTQADLLLASLVKADDHHHHDDDHDHEWVHGPVLPVVLVFFLVLITLLVLRIRGRGRSA